MKHLNEIVGSLGLLALVAVATDAKAMVLPDSAVTNQSGTAFGVYCTAASAHCLAGVATGNGGFGVEAAGGPGGVGVYATSSAGGMGVQGSTDSGYGVSGNASSNGTGVFGSSASGYGVDGSSGGMGVRGSGPTGVYGNGSIFGVQGRSPASFNQGAGIYGTTSSNQQGVGVKGEAGPGSTGVWGFNPNGQAAWFDGAVTVKGNFSVTNGTKNFEMDDPLDPANKVLRHAAVESPDMKNIYDGVFVLDQKGEGWVELPKYFAALNKDFRYQLTNIGGFAPTYVAEEITNNRFKIAGGKPGMKVSWQVTGVRHDAWAEDHPMVVEEVKAPEARGKLSYSRTSAVVNSSARGGS